MASKKEKIEYAALPVLFLVLAIVAWKFAFSDGATPPPPSLPSKTSSVPAKPKAPLHKVSSPQSAGKQQPADMAALEALDLSRLTRKPVAVGKTGRGNIFNYWVAPPPPPKPPDPPPPIQLAGIEPHQVFAQTKGFALKVRGAEFPASSSIYVDGVAYPTTRVSGTELSTAISENFIKAAGSHKVTVRSNDAKLTHSNEALLNVVAPPAPPYSYVGLITTGEGPTAVLVDRETRRSVQKGQKIDQKGRWEVVDINSKEIQIRDTELQIVHKIAFRGDLS